jgi:hypothetical protein
MKHLISLTLASVLVLLLSCGFASAQNSANTQTLQQATGHSSNYDAAKEAWVKENPAAYDAMNGTATSTQRVAEGETMPWGAPENKESWIAQNPERYAEMQKPVEARSVITQEDLKQLPADKQEAMRKAPHIKIND